MTSHSARAAKNKPAEEFLQKALRVRTQETAHGSLDSLCGDLPLKGI